MEKKLYALAIHETLEHVMPPLQSIELELLTQSLLTEGCRDPLVVWNGVIIDGHNRYRICHENSIPFSYVEMDFHDESEARTWIIRNQLARRNVPDYVRCEMVLPLEDELKALAKKRQGWKKAGSDVLPNLVEGKKTTTQEALAEIAGVSHGSFDKARKLIDSADEETKDKLRRGEISIHKAYTELREKENTPQALLLSEGKEGKESVRARMPGDLVPGYGVEQILGPLQEGANYHSPDPSQDTPPIEVYGNMRSDNMALRGNAELIHAKSDLQDSTDYYVRRVSEILRGMSMASTNKGNITALRDIVTAGYSQIMAQLDEKYGGIEDE